MAGAFHSANDIEAYIEETEGWVNSFLETLGWESESVTESLDYIVCSHNPNHYIPVESLDRHCEQCEAAKKGYSQEDIAEDKSSDFYYEKATKVVPIKLSDETLMNIISAAGIRLARKEDLPKTMKRYMCNFSPQERLKVYEYCVQSAKAAYDLKVSEEELLLLSEANGKRTATAREKSRLEILSEERDQKRRRQSYKGKKVHSGKKSHLEVLKEVIENQMEILQEIWTEDQNAEDEKSKQDGSKEKEVTDSYSREDPGCSRSLDRYSRNTDGGYSRERERFSKETDSYSRRGPDHYSRDREWSSRDRDRSSRERDRSSRDRDRSSRDGDYYSRSRRHRERDSSQDRDGFRDRNRDETRNRDENSESENTTCSKTEAEKVYKRSRSISRSYSRSRSRSYSRSRSRSRSRSPSRSRSKKEKKRKRKSERSDRKKKKKHKSRD